MSRSTRRTSVIINLLKVPGGYQVENDQRGNTIQIPKQFINQSSKIKSKSFYNHDSSQEVSSTKHKRKELKIKDSYTPPALQTPQQQQWQIASKQQSRPQQQIVQVPTPQPEILPLSNVEQIAKQRQPTKYTLVIPSCSAWFSLENVHKIEMDALPEYFTGQRPSKSLDIYKRQRNFIVQLYRSNPQSYLSATACRRALAGDACGIARIHAFLQHWGIINFNVDPETYPGRVFPIVDQRVFNQQQQDDTDDGGQAQQDLTNSEQLMVNSIKVLSKNYRPVCDYCGIICGLVWYQQRAMNATLPNMQIKEIKLCIKCYSNSNFPSIFSSEDFQRSNIEQQFERTDIFQKLQKLEQKQPFSPEETVTLLTLVEERPGTQWDTLCQIMNENYQTQRTPEEVMLHYLQLPFKNMGSIQSLIEQQELDPDGCGYQEVLRILALQEPNLYSDYSNVLNYHVELFKKLLRKYDKKIEEKEEISQQQVMKEEEQKISNNNIDEFQDQSYPIKQLTDSNNIHSYVDQLQKINPEDVLKIKEDTIERALSLAQVQEEKLKESMRLMISIQMEKLELKLNYLEEYEKLILYEKKQLDQQQKAYLVDRLQIMQQKLQKIE